MDWLLNKVYVLDFKIAVVINIILIIQGVQVENTTVVILEIIQFTKKLKEETFPYFFSIQNMLSEFFLIKPFTFLMVTLVYYGVLGFYVRFVYTLNWFIYTVEMSAVCVGERELDESQSNQVVICYQMVVEVWSTTYESVSRLAGLSPNQILLTRKILLRKKFWSISVIHLQN